MGNNQKTLTILFHSIVLEKNEKLFMKEVWADYIENNLAEYFDDVLVLTQVTTENLSFLNKEISNPKIKVVKIPGFANKTIFYKIINSVVYLYEIFASIRVSRYVWIFFPSIRCVIGGLFCILTSKPYAVYVGGDSREVYAKLQTFFGNPVLTGERIIAKKADFVLSAGSTLYERFLNINPKTYKRRPATRLTKNNITPQLDSIVENNNEIKCLFVGSISPTKGINILLDTFAKLVKELRTIRLVLIGPCSKEYEDEVRSFLKKHDLENIVDLVGYVTNGELLWGYYRNANLFIFPSLPSHGEGFPRVLYEAMAHGLPIVTTNVGGIAGELTHEKNCLLVNPYSCDELIYAVKRIVSDEILRRRLIKNGYEFVYDILSVSPKDQVAHLLKTSTGEIYLCEEQSL